MLGANALMSTRLRGSEEALATLACERIAGRPRPALLIGGLGMGFTLRAALGALGRDAKVAVSELVPAIVELGARADGACPCAAASTIRGSSSIESDVGDLIAAARDGYDFDPARRRQRPRRAQPRHQRPALRPGRAAPGQGGAEAGRAPRHLVGGGRPGLHPPARQGRLRGGGGDGAGPCRAQGGQAHDLAGDEAALTSEAALPRRNGEAAW